MEALYRMCLLFYSLQSDCIIFSFPSSLILGFSRLSRLSSCLFLILRATSNLHARRQITEKECDKADWRRGREKGKYNTDQTVKDRHSAKEPKRACAFSLNISPFFSSLFPELFHFFCIFSPHYF